MAKNYLSAGIRIAIPANAVTKAVESGELYAFQKMIGVLLHKREANQENVLGLGHVWNVAKKTGAGTGFVFGQVVYAEDDAGILKATATVASNPPLGVAVAAGADGDTTAQVKLYEVPNP